MHLTRLSLLACVLGIFLLSSCRDGTGPERPGVGSIRLSADSVRLSALGDSVRLQVTPVDASGSPLTGRNVVWSTSDTTVATVSETGLVRAVGYGDTEVLVRVDTVTARAVVSVGELGVRNWSVARRPAVTGAHLSDVWVAGDGTVFAVGTGGAAVRFAGQAWTALSTGTTEDLVAVAGSSASNVYAVSEKGSILHWDGLAWSRSYSAGTLRTLNDVWVASDGQVFAVGDDRRDGHLNGYLVHWDGKEWVEKDFDLSPRYVEFFGVWGSSSRDVYVVGAYASSGIIYHFDGTSWEQVQGVPTNGYFKSVHGSGPGDVWAAGDESTIAHFDGTDWTVLESPIRIWVQSVWSTSPTDAYLAGYSSTVGRTIVLHYDGTRMTQLPMPTQVVRGIELKGAAASPSISYLVGGNGLVLRGSGTTWEVAQYGPDLADIAGMSDRSVVAVGTGAAAFVYDGADWVQATPPPIPSDLVAVLPGSHDVTVIASGGTRYRFDGRSWTLLSQDYGGGYTSAWVDPDGKLYLTRNDYMQSFRNTPASWGRSVREPTGTAYRSVWESERSQTEVSLHGIWGRSSREIYAVGSGGLIVGFDGSAWAPMASGTTRDLYGVGGAGGAVFAVGAGGLILRRVDGSWAPVPSGTTATLRGVWGSSESNVYVVGDGGTILRFDGRRWNQIASGTDARLNAVWGSDGSVFVSGSRGVILAGR